MRLSWFSFKAFNAKQLVIFKTGDFIDKMKRIGKIPERSFLVTADVVGLYPSIQQKE